MRKVAALIALLAAPAAAQETPVSPAEFLNLAAGNTLTFVMAGSGDLVGIERFLSRERSIWTRADGTCAYGEITTDDAQVCFLYDDDPLRLHCWLPFEADGSTFVRSTANAEVQRIAEVGQSLLGCEGEPMS
ncbi:hypothetical protein [Jannaschia sp. LMIT008]|uniref:hypothetical protein n=1 Tax=Jannaschia maritima TaxID=3032585 RepID=UPI002811A6E0|nr:hypothetical protein [Jannaschia sp. LMIT008]